MKYISLRDKHLNIFVPYGIKDKNEEQRTERLENNITKAFINVLQSLHNDKKIEDEVKIFKDLFDIDITEKDEIKFYLQNKGVKKEIVKGIKEENRILFAFCPEGKCWGIEGLDINDSKKIKKQLKDDISNDKPGLMEKELNDEVKLAYNDILDVYKRKGESIPDAWIFIYRDNNPLYVIAFENKKYRLDPFQLKNHIEKSLFLNVNNDGRIIYKKYSEIITSLKNSKSNKYIIDSFIEYLMMLNLYEVDDFESAFGADEDLRKEIAYKYFGKKIMEGLKLGEVDERRGSNVWRIKVNYKYIQEINLGFDKNVYLQLAFFPNQRKARAFYDKGDVDKLSKIVNAKQSFHLQNIQRNLKKSYISNEKWDVKDYINYWKKNVAKIKEQDSEGMRLLYKDFFDNHIIDRKDYEYVISNINCKKVRIVPELVVYEEWDYEDIANIGMDEFIKDIKNKIVFYFKYLDIDIN